MSNSGPFGSQQTEVLGISAVAGPGLTDHRQQGRGDACPALRRRNLHDRFAKPSQSYVPHNASCVRRCSAAEPSAAVPADAKRDNKR